MLASLALLTSLLGLSAVNPSLVFAQAKPGPGNGNGNGNGHGPPGGGPPGQAPGGPHGGKPSPSGPATSTPVGVKDVRTAVFAPSNYTVVDGVFIQSSKGFNATAFDVFDPAVSFGLVDQSTGRWQNLTDYVKKLNDESDELTSYKVIYIARHGEGYHNQAETFYGTPAWNCYWSLQTGDGNNTWNDATLTPKGIDQAKVNNQAWKKQIEGGVPLPQVLYSSPMRRSTATLNITWGDLLLDPKQAGSLTPLIKEHFRESIGLHTCDERSKKSEIAAMYPTWAFEPSFTQNDQLYTSGFQETSQQQTLRLQQLYNEIFATDDSAFIYIACHSGVIGSSFRALGHPVFRVQTGGMVPMLIKAVGHPSVTQPAIIAGNSNVGAPQCTVPITTAGSAPSAVLTSAPAAGSASGSASASAAASSAVSSPRKRRMSI